MSSAGSKPTGERPEPNPGKPDNSNVSRTKISQLPGRRSTAIEPGKLDIALDGGEDANASFTERINRNRYPLSSFLVSMILHTTMFLLLAVLAIGFPEKEQNGVIAILSSDPVFEKPELDDETIEIALPDEAESPMESKFEDISNDNLLEAAANENVALTPANDADSSSEERPVVENGTVASGPTGGGLEGRKRENRARLAAARGATEASEAAVERGLRWLVNHQHSNGAWHLQLDKGPCNGKCRDSGTIESQNAATGLALLAFLGAGYTHQTGRYQDQVGMGLSYLQGRMRKKPFGGSLIDDTMYSHGIATVALAEAYHMTGDEDLRETVQMAVDYIEAAQHRHGGWRYRPGQPGDMTVSGWQLMALKSAQLAGIEVAPEVYEKAGKFLDRLSDSGGSYYGYQSPEKQPTTTAVGLLMRMYLGWGRGNGKLDQGALWLVEEGPSRYDIYYNYYATQVLHHLSHEQWPAWNKDLRDYLVRQQFFQGHEDGSWHFPDEHGSVGGRVYTTAMAIMILEVYYRYMPLYSKEVVD